MKLRKRNKVEVTNVNEVKFPQCAAEILSGNGHTYHLEYESYPGIASQHNAETDSRISARPCQPLVQGVEEFAVGEIVEVFYECGWKTAAILKILQGKGEIKSKKISLRAAAVQNRFYLVKLLEGSAEPIIDGSKIRAKQTWHNDKQILLEKSSQGAEDFTASKPSTSICHQIVNYKIPPSYARTEKETQENCLNILNESQFMESYHDSRFLKRMSPCAPSVNEAHNEYTLKFRAIEKDRRKQRQAIAPVHEEFGAVSYPRQSRKMGGNKNMHEFLKVIPTGGNQMVQEKINDIPGIRNSQLNTSDSDASSVGSCSITDRSPENLGVSSMLILNRQTDAVCSDAESGCGLSFERTSNSLPSEEEVEISIRRLELQAYRRTLEALYASGPLSWEQESMLTNLRIMLHISNDEHLTELKYLISAKTTGQVGGILDLLPSLKLMPQSQLAQSFWILSS